MQVKQRRPALSECKMLASYLIICTVICGLWLWIFPILRRKCENPTCRIPALGFLDLVKLLLVAYTKFRNMPNYEVAFNLAKEHGMLAVNLPTRTLIVSTDWKVYKAVLSSNVWTDRTPDNYYISVTQFNKPLGLIFGCGEDWKRANQSTTQILHQLDFYKPNKMEEFIRIEMEEIEEYLDLALEASGKELVFTPHGILQPGTLNVIWQVLAGHRFPQRDPIMTDLIARINKANETISPGYSILDIFPFLKIFPRLTYLGEFKDTSAIVYDMFRNIIREKNERKRNSGGSAQVEDLIDGLVEELEKSGGKDPFVTEEALLVILRDMVMGGADTVNSALEHGLLHVSIETDIQKRVQAEIDDAIGDSRIPTYSDRARMPYTQAVLLETLRVSSPVPMSGRTCIEDTALNGYEIKKGSLLTINIYGIHHSKDLWEDPDVFRPERFLDENMSIINSDKIIPFGLGKRTCAGLSVGRINLFIFFVRLLQKFEFKISDFHPPPSFENPIGLARHPRPYYVKMSRRTIQNTTNLLD